MLILIGGEKIMDTLTVGLEWFLNPDHMPLIIGIEKGWFADAQLDVHMIEPEAHFIPSIKLHCIKSRTAVPQFTLAFPLILP